MSWKSFWHWKKYWTVVIYFTKTVWRFIKVEEHINKMEHLFVACLVELIKILIWHVMKNSQVHNHDHHQINMKKSSFFFSFWSWLITCIRYSVGFFMDTCLLNGTRFCSYYLKFRHVQGHILASTYLTKC